MKEINTNLIYMPNLSKISSWRITILSKRNITTKKNLKFINTNILIKLEICLISQPKLLLPKLIIQITKSKTKLTSFLKLQLNQRSMSFKIIISTLFKAHNPLSLHRNYHISLSTILFLKNNVKLLLLIILIIRSKTKFKKQKIISNTTFLLIQLKIRKLSKD